MEIKSNDFAILCTEGGALDAMMASMSEIRSILLVSNLSEKENKTLGHCGIPGEYIHGLDYARQFGQKQLQGTLLRPNSPTGIDMLVGCFNKPSQMNSALKQIGIQCNENAFDALSRAVNSARFWLSDTDKLSDQAIIQMSASIGVFEENLNLVKAFITTNTLTSNHPDPFMLSSTPLEPRPTASSQPARPSL